jgi:hypothetical protein
LRHGASVDPYSGAPSCGQALVSLTSYAPASAGPGRVASATAAETVVKIDTATAAASLETHRVFMPAPSVCVNRPCHPRHPA